MTPGIYDIPAAEYHQSPGLSKGGIDRLLSSPLHYYDHFLAPDREPSTPTDAMIIGSAVHTATLEPDLFGPQYCCAPTGIDKRTKDGKAAWGAFVAENAGKVVLSADDFERVQKIAAAVRAHPTVQKILADGRAEQSVYWTDTDTGVLCRSRPDWMRPGMLADLKTCMDASQEFQRSIFNMGYHRQAAHYLDAVRAHGDDHSNFVFIAVEKSRPFAVACYVLDDAAIALGREENRRAREIYARCMETGVWPGYPAQIQTISLPNYAFKRAA